MNVPIKLNQEQLKTILLSAYRKGEENEPILLEEIINEIKEELLVALNNKLEV